jgi:hypothetical protein
MRGYALPDAVAPPAPALTSAGMTLPVASASFQSAAPLMLSSAAPTRAHLEHGRVWQQCVTYWVLGEAWAARGGKPLHMWTSSRCCSSVHYSCVCRVREGCVAAGDECMPSNTLSIHKGTEVSRQCKVTYRMALISRRTSNYWGRPAGVIGGMAK